MAESSSHKTASAAIESPLSGDCSQRSEIAAVTASFTSFTAPEKTPFELFTRNLRPESLLVCSRSFSGLDRSAGGFPGGEAPAHMAHGLQAHLL